MERDQPYTRKVLFLVGKGNTQAFFAEIRLAIWYKYLINDSEQQLVRDGTCSVYVATH